MSTNGFVDPVAEAALNLYDWAHLLGPRFTRTEWKAVFAPNSNMEAAWQKFTRHKRALRRYGVVIKTRAQWVTTKGAEDGATGGRMVDAVYEFESLAYMLTEVTRLIGDPEHYAGGDTKISEAEYRQRYERYKRGA